MKLIKKIAESQQKTLYSLIQPHIDVLHETVGPRKYLKIRHYPENALIGLLEGLEFCSSTQPQIFTFNLSINEHAILFEEITRICDGDEAILKNICQNKNLQEFISLRKTALNTLSSFYHLIEKRDIIFSTLHRALAHLNNELQECAYDCLKKYLANSEVFIKQHQAQHPNENLNLKAILTIAGDHLREYLQNITEHKSLNLNIMQHLTYITRLYPTILNEKFSEYILKHLKLWLESGATSITQQKQVISVISNEIKISSAIISLFAELQSTPARFVDTLIQIVLKYERAFMLDSNDQVFRKPLSLFLKRYPFETLQYLIKVERLKELYTFKFLLYIIKTEPAFINVFKNEPNRLISLLNGDLNIQQTTNSDTISATTTKPGPEIQFLCIYIIYKLSKLNDGQWLSDKKVLITYLLENFWSDEKFHESHLNLVNLDYIFWKEVLYLFQILFRYHKQNKNTDIEVLFQTVVIFQNKSLIQYNDLLKIYLRDHVYKSYSCEWKRNAFNKFIQLFSHETENASSIYSQNLRANILQYILIPCIQYCCENGQLRQLIACEANPASIDDDNTNIIHLFINKVIQPEAVLVDSLRIYLLQLSSLFVQYAHEYIHDVNNKKHGSRLRRLMTFAWQCLLSKNCVDPYNKYYGHLVLCHIISKFAIHKRIILQVLNSLLKAHTPEARVIVRQALEILIPILPTKMDDGYQTLAQWTKKILIEESHHGAQSAHILYIIVKYYKIYYYIRHTLINHMISTFQKLGYNSNTANEHKQLAIDLTEVILKWEAQRARDIVKRDNDPSLFETLLFKHPDMLKPFEKHVADSVLNSFVKTACPINENGHGSNQNDQLSKRCLNLFKQAVANDIWPNADVKFEILERVFLSLENISNNTNQNSQQPAQQGSNNASLSPNYTSICTALEIVTFLIGIYSKAKIQNLFRILNRGISICIMCNQTRVIKNVANMIQKLMIRLPIECFNSPIINTIASTAAAENESGDKPMEVSEDTIIPPCTPPASVDQQSDTLYTLFGQPDGVLCRTIIDGLSSYDKSSIASGLLTSTGTYSSSTTLLDAQQQQLQQQQQQQPSLKYCAETLSNCLLLLKAASSNNPQYIDRIMGPFMKVLQKLYRDHLNSSYPYGGVLNSTQATSTSQAADSQSSTSIDSNTWTDLLIQSLELVKNRVGVMSVEMRKMFIQSILTALIDKSNDVKLIRFIVQMVSDWIKYKNGPLLNQIPSMKERLALLQRLVITIEKRYADNLDIQSIFLQTIAFVYKDEVYNTNQEFKIKLENAFLAGLKCTNTQIRQQFFDLFNLNLNTTDLFDRLCFIIVSQNWEPFGIHYWIKQCIQLTLGSCARANTNISYSDAFANFKFMNILNSTRLFKQEMPQTATKKHEFIDSNIVIMMDYKTNLFELNDISDTDSEDKFELYIELDMINDSSIKFVNNMEYNEKFLKVLSKYGKIEKMEVSDEEDNTDVKVHGSSTTSIIDMIKEQHDFQKYITKNRQNLINFIVKNEFKLFKYCKKIRIGDMLQSLCQLCHLSNDLAHQIWIQLFIQMFNSLNTKQQQTLHGELTPFVASGSHIIQKQCQISALNTFLESFSLGKPAALFLRPSLMSYIAKSHNLWHRIILLLENALYTDAYSTQSYPNHHQVTDLIQQPQSAKAIQHETLSALLNLLQYLKEDDYRAGLWYKRAIHDKTRLAICYEQQGCFIQAQKLYEENFSNALQTYLTQPTNADELLEYNLWEERWIKCCKELNQWDELTEYATSKETDVCFTLDCAWKQADWTAMRTLLLQQQTGNISKENLWKYNLYQGYYLVFNNDDFHLFMGSTLNNANLLSNLTSNGVIETKVEKCINLAIKEWRRLPRLVGAAHTYILQGAQQIVELQEAFQIQNNLQIISNNQVNNTITAAGTTASNSTTNNQTALQEIKAFMKTWRTRLPLINDDISYWYDIFTWRQYHYESFTRFYEKQASANSTTPSTPNNHAMHGVHAVAHGIVSFGKIARKQHLYELCLATLNKIHTKQSVPIIDCYLKVKQEIKCYINAFEYLNSQQASEILELIESTNLKYFTRENVAELLSLKAQFLQIYGKFEDANNLYSYSTYLNDTQPKIWGPWGDYLTEAFVSICAKNTEAFQKRSIDTAESALIALLNAARHSPASSGECKVRKYISKILWLLLYDNDKRILHSTFELYATNVPSANWINWIPQLITLLVKDEGKYFTNLMQQIIRHYPLAMYYPLRTLYLKLKSDEQAEKRSMQLQHIQNMQSQDVEMKESLSDSIKRPSLPTTPNSQTLTVPAESLLRVSTLMHRQREIHPTLFNTLEGLIEQLLWLKIHWYEEFLKEFKQTLHYCYTIAFENSKEKALQNYNIDPFSIIWFRKLYRNYVELSVEKLNQQAQTNPNQSIKRYLAISNDPDYKLQKTQFLADFNFAAQSGGQQATINLFTFIQKLRNWIQMLEAKIRLQTKVQLLDERLRFVTQFCSSVADIEIPGEYLMSYNLAHSNSHSTHNSNNSHYYVKISRFLPRVESVEKYNSYSKRIYIRGHNGKIYPFLLSSEINFNECRKEQHQLQLLRMLNLYLCKQKETAKRNLYYHIPRVVPLQADTRLIEDNTSSISILDIYKYRMRKLSIVKSNTTSNVNTNSPSTSSTQAIPQILQLTEAADLPLKRYYDRIVPPLISQQQQTPQTPQTKQFFIDLYKHIQATFVPKTVIKEWALYRYADATDYFHFRKMFTTQLALYGLVEYVFYLTRINPDQFYISQDSGICQNIRLKFDINETTGDFNSDRPVFSRLTPNVVEFITNAGLYGVLNTVKIAVSRCLMQPQFHLNWILKAIIKDEIHTWSNQKKVIN